MIQSDEAQFSEKTVLTQNRPNTRFYDNFSRKNHLILIFRSGRNECGEQSLKISGPEKIVSQDIESSRNWACLGNLRANLIFSSLVYGSDLILHTMIV